MEPFWNFGRINQVFGRAIRFKSHKDLPEDKRNVEQYLYMSFMPFGNDIESIYKSMKENQDLWSEVRGIDIQTNIKETLLNKYPEVYNTINKILSVKVETDDRTIDQMMFDIMERKHKISNKITDIIKESSVDCIQNTKDNFALNQRCLRFSDLLEDEMTLFPGVTAETLNDIDTKQIKSKYLEKVSDDLYVLSALQEGREIFIYYDIVSTKDKPDIRYIRENGKRVCDLDLTNKKIYFYENKKHPINNKLGPKFSVYQTIYNLHDDLHKVIDNDGKDKKFPELDKFINEDNIHGYSIRYNVNEKLFYKFKTDIIFRLYPYDQIESAGFIRYDDYEPIVLHESKFYIAK